MAEKLAIGHVRALFASLHGMYGNQVLDRFRTGQVVDGADAGVASAQRMWLAALSAEFTPHHVQKALELCARQHKTWPPTLPEYRDLCRAVKRAEPIMQPPPDRLIGMSEEVRRAHIQRMRESLALGRIKGVTVTLDSEPGLRSLLALCAHAAGIAGADEAATLLGLESKFKAVK